jgi:hypothetical protein
MRLFLATVLVGLLFVSPAVVAQAPQKKVERAPRADADPLAAQRRAMAVSLLTSLADKARTFRDGTTLRARAQARAADALWELDPEQSRTLFRRAWADADAADREIGRKRAEERKAQLAASGVSMQGNAPALRAEVLRLAGKRDRALGEEFLSQLVQAADDAEPDAIPSPDELTPAEGQRLSLALRLLEEGDTPRAVQFATSALGHVTRASVKFLTALREKDAPAADNLFASLLARASADPGADANTVSLLSAYVFTPFTFFTAYRTAGTGMNSSGRDLPAPDLAPALRASFMRSAAQILLRPTTPQEYDNTSAGRSGSYLIIRRLLPLFDRFAPEATPALNARAALLLADVPERLRSPAMDRALAKGIMPEEPTTRDEIGEILEQAARTPNVADRDNIYAGAAVNATWKGDPRAEEIIDKIVDLDLLRRVRAFSDFSFVNTAIEKNKDAEAALARARKGDLTPLQRAWALERAADLIAKTDRAGAVSLLDEATAEARRIPEDDVGRARALVAVATRYEKLDRARTWELMNEVVKAANSAPAFTGEDGEMAVQFRNKRGGWMTSFDVEEFNLGGVLSALATEDMNRAVQLADGFTNEAARTSAVVAVARSVLHKGN